jgi:hypothetical protein
VLRLKLLARKAEFFFPLQCDCFMLLLGSLERHEFLAADFYTA